MHRESQKNISDKGASAAVDKKADAGVSGNQDAGKASKEPKPAAATEAQPTATQENKNATEPASADNKAIKDEIYADLEIAIKELEASIADASASKDQESSGDGSEPAPDSVAKTVAPSANVQEGKTVTAPADKGTGVASGTSAVQKDALREQDVVLNVEQIIDQEVKNREEKERTEAIKKFIGDARERLLRGAFKEAFEIIQKAKQL